MEIVFYLQHICEKAAKIEQKAFLVMVNRQPNLFDPNHTLFNQPICQPFYFLITLENWLFIGGWIFAWD